MSAEIAFRPGTVADSYTVLNLFEQTLADLNERHSSAALTSVAGPQRLARMWRERKLLVGSNLVVTFV